MTPVPNINMRHTTCDTRCGRLRVVLLVIAAAAALSCRRPPETTQAPPPARPAVQRVAQAKAEWRPLVVEVIEATRSGASLTVRFRFTNSGPGPFEFGDRFAFEPPDRDSLADVAVLEPSGSRKYFVLRDRWERPDCSAGIEPLRPGETRELFVRFPAPPPETTSITILVPHVPEIRDVPVGSGDQKPGSGV